MVMPVSPSSSSSALPQGAPSADPPSASGAGPTTQAAPDGLPRRTRSARETATPDAGPLRTDLATHSASMRWPGEASGSRLAPPATGHPPVAEVKSYIARLIAGEIEPPRTLSTATAGAPPQPAATGGSVPARPGPTAVVRPAGGENELRTMMSTQSTTDASSTQRPPLNSPERAEQESSSLLTRDQREHPSDRHDGNTVGGSNRSSFHDGGSVHGLSNRFARPNAASGSTANIETRHVVVQMPADVAAPPPPPTSAERITGALGAMAFHATDPVELAAQRAMETEYVAWATGVAQARERAFGPAGYAVGQDRKIALGDAALPAVYDGVRQFISSSSRSPVVNYFSTLLGPQQKGVDKQGQAIRVGELNYRYDATLAGGVAGGVTAHLVDSTVLTAMDRRSRLANFPQLKAVDLKTLVPDPSPVQLSVVDGPGGKVKKYSRLAQAGADAPTAEALAEQVAAHRQSLSNVQNTLQAKDFGLLAQPLVSGAANVLRRVGLPDKFLLQPVHVLWGSVVSSGTGGGVTKLGLGLAKPAAYADVDNLVGGTQRVNLFARKLPQADVAPASMADLKGLPGYVRDVAKESGQLAAQFVAGPWRASGGVVPSGHAVLQRVGDLARVIGANVLGSVFAAATGPFVAQIMRGGSATPQPGESQRSGAYLLQQFMQSATNDFAWQTAKEGLKGNAFDLGTSLDRWRDHRQARQTQSTLAVQRELPGLARDLERAMPQLRAPSLAGEALQQLQEIRADDGLQLPLLQRAAQALRPIAQESAAARPVLERIEAALASQQRHDEMARWRDPSVADRAR